MHLTSYFPSLLTYERFVARSPDCCRGCSCCSNGSADRASVRASTSPLAVRDNHRIRSKKVFAGVAARGKSSVGWFYGLKAYLVINGTGRPAIRTVGQLRHHAR